jgi:hypothetical protein
MNKCRAALYATQAKNTFIDSEQRKSAKITRDKHYFLYG